MSFKTYLKNPLNQQYIAEILFPILGYLFFDWSLLIIVLFYLIDQLAAQILFLKRLHTINQFHQIKNGPILIMISTFSFIAFFSIELYGLYLAFEKLSDLTGNCFTEEVLSFIKNELWLLFPLLILVYYMQDKLTFYMPRRFETQSSKNYVLINFIENCIITILVVIGSYMYQFLTLPDLIVIALILVIKIAYDILLRPKIKFLTAF
jgi:hypothetical protein